MLRSRSMKRCILYLLTISLVLTALSFPIGKNSVKAASGGAYETNTYRNLFAEIGKSQSEIDAKLQKAFDQMFYGDDSTQRLFYPVGTDKAYIMDVGDNDVRSEGMSYGMMICVQMDKKKEFDMLWKWAKEYMYHADGQFKGFFAWQCSTSGSKMDNTPASDGEEYFATSLLFASNRWGDGTGIYNYSAEAKALLDAMLHQSDDGVGVNMFNKTEKKVVFCPTSGADAFSDPSYHLPAFYELWALWGEKDNSFWSDAASASRQFFQKATNSTTGLAPDYANFDGSPKDVSWSSGHADFRFDAWRVASNIAVDYAWWGKDSWQVTFADRIQGFFYKEGISSYGNQFTVSGSKLSSDHSPGLVAMNAVASLASTNKSNEFVEELWKVSIPSGKWRYYDGMLYMMGLLHCSGNFKIWKPDSGEILCGDINVDKAVNSIDFALLRKHLLGMSILTGNNLLAADMNKDGSVNSIDFALLRQILLGMPS
ncbi:glycosyl hydrolase family 8 [Acetivibrio cellulolyticus]|uniref:glycosyl hydrolase family 8 n=1 Tax=Acetivibrio cellulolyticus TaxID=35830 RepID=UPI0001E2D112|nr:glycosyl hydrolase family 8 [Acetivibrio cellulolyticus]